MDFHINFTPTALPRKIQYRDPIFLIGSCFTEHIAGRLSQFKFQVLENPHGILFNPASIVQSVNDCIQGRRYTTDDLFEEQGIWSSWDFHSRFSHPDPQAALDAMNHSVAGANAFLKQCRWMVITLGSAFVYQLLEGRTVANCHKAPAQHFRKRLMPPEEVLSTLDTMLHKLRVYHPGMQFLFTVSPVRHLREGLVENNRSKAVLIHCVHQLCAKFEDVHYFPAYELVVDDLRDYRFYAEDMVHPNYQATAYVWEKFVEAAIDPGTREIMKDVNQLLAAIAHKPLHPQSSAHQQFRLKQKQWADTLMAKYPWLDLKAEAEHFATGN
jgi:GSCFA family